MKATIPFPILRSPRPHLLYAHRRQPLPVPNLSTNIPTAYVPGTNATSASASSLPDLIVSNVYLGMQGIPTNWAECIPNYGPFEIRAMIRNLGETPAYNIDAAELSSGTHLTIGELGAGQGMEMYFPLASASVAYNVVVDSQNTIPESNEDNNTLSYLAITPTPPALCTPPSTPLPNLSTSAPSSGSGSATLSQSVLQNSIYRSPDWGNFNCRMVSITAAHPPRRNRQRATPPVFKARFFMVT
jgi:hypothetical protein